jgi:hypothetical protein
MSLATCTQFRRFQAELYLPISFSSAVNNKAAEQERIIPCGMIISFDHFHFAKNFFDKELTAPILRHGTAWRCDACHINRISSKSSNNAEALLHVMTKPPAIFWVKGTLLSILWDFGASHGRSGHQCQAPRQHRGAVSFNRAKEKIPTITKGFG